jgi:transcriptional regulator with XRE-family HTH domain
MHALSWSRMMKPLGNLVKDAREKKGLSQEELAERLGVSKGWVGQVETGRIDRPRPKYLALLEQHLGISRDDLARSMNMIGPAATGDVLVEIRRIRQISDPKERAAALRRLPQELYEEIEWLALDMVRRTFEQAKE